MYPEKIIIAMTADVFCNFSCFSFKNIDSAAIIVIKMHAVTAIQNLNSPEVSAIRIKDASKKILIVR